MTRITLSREIDALLPETSALLRVENLVVHSRVQQVNVVGSRGLYGRARSDSDLDLSLLVDDAGLRPGCAEHEDLLREVICTTLEAWRGSLELDLAAIFDQHGCGLPCFNWRNHDPNGCPLHAGVDCCGVYKLQRGFTGYVPPFGVRVELMYPLVILWRRVTD